MKKKKMNILLIQIQINPTKILNLKIKVEEI